MTDDLDTLRREADRAELEAKLLAEACDRLNPRESHGRNSVLAADVRFADYPDDEAGRLRACRDWDQARANYLRQRWHTLAAAADRRAEWAKDATRGIDRFTGDGRYRLDDLAAVAPHEVAVDKARERVAAMQEQFS